MKKFKQITLIEDCRLSPEILPDLQQYAEKPVVMFQDSPVSDEEILTKIGDSDAIFLSWKTKINASVLRQCPQLKYIGLCCSMYENISTNVDIETAKELGITVKGVRDYGDEGTVEFIISQLISLFKGIGKAQWRSESTELTGKSLGIIGLGTLGQMVAKTAQFFGMKVYYYNRSRKSECENLGIQFLSLPELLATCDVISVHLPKYTVLLNEEEFAFKKKNSILINTSVGLTFDKDAFLKWLQNDSTSFAILDADGAGTFYEEFNQHPQIITYPFSAGFTAEARRRLSEKVLKNVEEYL